MNICTSSIVPISATQICRLFKTWVADADYNSWKRGLCWWTWRQKKYTVLTPTFANEKLWSLNNIIFYKYTYLLFTINKGLNLDCLPREMTPSNTQVGKECEPVMLITAHVLITAPLSFSVPVWYSVCPLNVESFEILYFGNLASMQSSALTSQLGVVSHILSSIRAAAAVWPVEFGCVTTSSAVNTTGTFSLGVMCWLCMTVRCPHATRFYG